jgi:putative glutamine amidotransferase
MSIRVAVTCGTAAGAARYVRALEAVGLEALIMAPPEQRSLADVGVDGLLLTGGTDVDPELYGQTRQDETETPDRPRDRMENRLLREALKADLPVLGICRGMQFLNVFHGGTLVQHHSRQAKHRVRTGDRSLPAHDVIVQTGTRLAGILGDARCAVNSRHHQAADRVSYQLQVSARATDGIVEGLERKDKAFVVAVQWHPEDQIARDARQRKLFEAFKNALRGRELRNRKEGNY